MSLGAELTKLRRNETFDTNLDPDPEWWSAHLTNCNNKSTTLSSLCIKLSTTLIRVKVSELQMREYCI